MHLTVSLAMCGLTVFLGYYARRSDFWVFLSAYAMLFGLYSWIVTYIARTEDGSRRPLSRYYTALGIALRIVLLFNIPNLSDDLYRFLWDGHMTLAGIHPFAHPPVWFVENQVPLPGIVTDLYPQLNSPRYFSVYPPVCQGVFALAAWLAPNSIWGSMLGIKLFLLTCEIGTVTLLSKFDSESHAMRRAPSTVLYALNPLVLLEVVGNCHFEGAMIFFLMAGLWMLREGRVTWPAVLWALAVASKLVPLMFLPLVWRWLGWRKGAIFVAVFGATSIALFAPLLNPEVLVNMSRSLDLYFQKFQFNASLYYLLRAVGVWQTGFDRGDLIGPTLGAAAAAGILLLACFRLKTQDRFGRLTEAMLLAAFLHLTCAATVHPWYITLPFVLSLTADKRYWFVWAWSAAVVLSYAHYADGLLQENYSLIAIEYAAVWAVFFGEIRKE